MVAFNVVEPMRAVDATSSPTEAGQIGHPKMARCSHASGQLREGD